MMNYERGWMKYDGGRMGAGTKRRNIIFIPHNSWFIICRRCGFTLLEVLIALAVMGGLLVTLISTLNYHLSLVEKQETITVATLLAKNKLADMTKNPEDNKALFDPPYEKFSYETSVKDSPYSGIAEVMVTVRSGNEEVTLNEFVFK
jgi:general secretion pathway protein I